jgi:hypothetical protein
MKPGQLNFTNFPGSNRWPGATLFGGQLSGAHIMAIIKGVKPEAPGAVSRVRVVIKLAKPPSSIASSALPDLNGEALSAVRRVVPELDVTPYFANEQLRAAQLAP